MAEHTIPQRELRNNSGEILRQASKGTTFTITVRGEPVAELGPPRPNRRVDVDKETILRILALPVDEGWAADLEDLREAPEVNPGDAD